MAYPKHIPDERDKRILRRVLVLGMTYRDVAKMEQISYERVRQILERLTVRIRPVVEVGNPGLVSRLCPEWLTRDNLTEKERLDRARLDQEHTAEHDGG